MKKLPTFILSTLIIGLATASINSPSASALYIDSDNATWYTAAELLEYKAELDQEESILCGTDENCRQELNFARMESENPKYWALEQLTQQQIAVTAVNPSEETLKVVFFDEDMMLRRMGISEPLELGEFYMGWFEYDVERIYNYGSYTEELFNNTLPGAHYVYAQKNVPENIIPANQEFAMSVAGTGLINNTSGEIAYAAFAEPFFNAMGRFSYASCLQESDYAEGVECRMMISAEKGTRFFPPRETIISDVRIIDVEESQDDESQNVVDEPEIIDEAQNTDEPQTTTPAEYFRPQGKGGRPWLDEENITPVGADSSDTIDAIESAVADTNSVISTSEIVTHVTNSLKAPDTGENTMGCEKIIEFPWWLIGLVIAGDAILLWLFWPNRQNRQKNY